MLAEAKSNLADLRRKLASIESDTTLAPLAKAHSEIGTAVLAETAKLHTGDAENLALWREFMPACMAAIQHIYDRLGVTFDETLGESFYHDRLQPSSTICSTRKIARESDGAIMRVSRRPAGADDRAQKKDGAFLYATTDLATIAYRANVGILTRCFTSSTIGKACTSSNCSARPSMGLRQGRVCPHQLRHGAGR